MGIRLFRMPCLVQVVALGKNSSVYVLLPPQYINTQRHLLPLSSLSPPSLSSTLHILPILHQKIIIIIITTH